jgi:hypothetical protein
MCPPFGENKCLGCSIFGVIFFLPSNVQRGCATWHMRVHVDFNLSGINYHACAWKQIPGFLNFEQGGVIE